MIFPLIFFIILLEQTGGNNRLLTTVRHSLTTCMQTTVTREPSITTILDYVGKGIRASTKNYIGREVISDELLARVEATGYGLIYFVDEMLKEHNHDLRCKKVVISGSGNVAIYAAEKVQELGACVIAMSDSNGYIVDEEGIDVELVKQIKEVERKRIKEYAKRKAGAYYFEGQKGIWSLKCDIALPCATQNDISLEEAKLLVENNVIAIGEGANMPCTNEAVNYLLENNVLLAPAKAANAGGVATSALEMAQNSMRLSWTFEEVDAKLKEIMINIFNASKEAAKEYGSEGNYVVGANIAGFLKVADAMMSQGII